MYLGEIRRWVPWAAGGMELLLSPLDAADDQAILSECRITEREQLPTDAPGVPTGKVLRTEIDYARRQQLIGRKCIHGWKGKTPPRNFSTKEPLICTPEAIDAFMLAQPAAEFVILQVQGLSLYVEQEIAEAGKGSGGSSRGSAVTALSKFAMRFPRGWSPWRANSRSR